MIRHDALLSRKGETFKLISYIREWRACRKYVRMCVVVAPSVQEVRGAKPVSIKVLNSESAAARGGFQVDRHGLKMRRGRKGGGRLGSE